MKRPEDPWAPEPMFERPGPEPALPFEAEAEAYDPPEFVAIRRIEHLSRLHHMAFRDLIQGEGLPPAQAGALRIVVRFPGMSQRELADRLHIQRATATVMLQKMEKAGYIDRRPDREDQRISRIYPTEAASALDRENQKVVNAYFARCFAGISPEEFSTMEKALTQLGQNLRQLLEEKPDLIHT